MSKDFKIFIWCLFAMLVFGIGAIIAGTEQHIDLCKWLIIACVMVIPVEIILLEKYRNH